MFPTALRLDLKPELFFAFDRFYGVIYWDAIHLSTMTKDEIKEGMYSFTFDEPASWWLYEGNAAHICKYVCNDEVPEIYRAYLLLLT